MVGVLPAVFLIGLRGGSSVTDLLNLSQVVLALQLPFAMFPLLLFVSAAAGCIGQPGAAAWALENLRGRWKVTPTEPPPVFGTWTKSARLVSEISTRARLSQVMGRADGTMGR